jgi:hypothetical protein
VALALYDLQPRPPAPRTALDEVVDRDPVMPPERKDSASNLIIR